MSPARRRQAVAMLRDRLDVSERRACRYVGQHRSTQRRDARPVVAPDDLALRAALREFAGKRKRWDYVGLASRSGGAADRLLRLTELPHF